MDALARGETDLRPGRDSVGSPVGVYGHVRFIIDLLIRQGVIHTDQHVAAAAVDYILGLVPVEMVRGILALSEVQQFLGIHLGVLVRHLAVAVPDGDERKADLVKITEAVVGNIPAEHAVAHLVILMADVLPLLRREAAERRQIALILCAHCLQLFQRLVYLTAFHICPSEIVVVLIIDVYDDIAMCSVCQENPHVILSNLHIEILLK